MKTEMKNSDATRFNIDQVELASLGNGDVVYIRSVSRRMAKKMYPYLAPFPKSATLFAVYSADGSPLILTDTWHDAFFQATEAELIVCSVN